MSEAARQTVARIRRVDADRQIVYAGVYAPNDLDTYGEFMFAEDIEQMAHKFMQLDLNGVIDTNHDNVPNGSYPIESYICRKSDDPDFAEGEWVIAVKISDDKWPEVLDGTLNGFSFEAMVALVDYEVECSVVRDHVGETLAHKGDAEDHSHLYFCQLNEKGNVVRGTTSPGPDGHVHVIKHATMTEKAEGHSHRFNPFAAE